MPRPPALPLAALLLLLLLAAVRPLPAATARRWDSSSDGGETAFSAAARMCHVPQIKCGPNTTQVKIDNANSLALVTDATMLSPQPRAYHAGMKATGVVSNMTFLAIFGGCTGMSSGDDALDDTWTLDFISQTWFHISYGSSVKPPARFAHDASATSDLQRMMVFGGLVPDGALGNTCGDGASAAINGTFADDTWLLLPSSSDGTRKWELYNATTHPTGRAGHSLATSTRGVLLFGGMTVANASDGEWRSSSSSRNSSSAGSGVQNAPPLVSGHRRTRAMDPSTLTALDDTWVFSDDTSGWVDVSDQGSERPPARHSHSAVTMSLPANPNQPDSQPWLESIVIFGGTSSVFVPIVESSHFFNDIWAWDVASRTWRTVVPATQPTSLPPPRHSHAAVVTANGTMVIYGGADAHGEHVRDIWEYDPHTNTWQELTAWFESPDPSLSLSIRSTNDNFQYRDIWGHVGLSVSTDVFPADVFVMFGGMHSELYFASASNDVNEFVRGLAPRPNDLVLWQPMSIGTGPFYRIQHTLVKHGDPQLKSVNGCPCEQKRPYVINNVEYVGCARPLGWDDYICPVAPGNCPLAQCIDDSMVLLKTGSFYYDFCSKDSLLLFGGRYDGDADHMGVADPRGKVWRLKPDTSVWEVGEPVHVDELPPPMSLHTMVRVGGYQQQRRGPPAWAPNSKDASQEGYLVFGGELESMPYCQQLDTIYYVEPPSPGRSTSWQIVTANLDVSMTDARLKRSGHGAVVHAYFNDGGVEEDMYIFGGYFLRGWADRPPVTGASLFLRYNIVNNTWYAVPVVNGPSPRFGHIMVYVAVPEPMIVVHGGENVGTRLGGQLLNDTWLYRFNTQEWIEVRQPWAPHLVLRPVWPEAREGHAAAVHGSKVVIQGGKRYVVGPNGKRQIYTDSMCAQIASGCGFCDMWVLDLANVSNPRWTMLPTDKNCQAANSPMLRHHAAGIILGNLFLFGGYEGQLGYASSSLYTTPLGCSAGSQSPNFYFSQCVDCPTGSFAPDQGYFCCLSCLSGTTTFVAGAVAPGNCSACDPKECVNGICTVDDLGGVHCTCYMGYLKIDGCRRPWVFIIPIFGLVAIMTFAMAYNAYRDYKKNQHIKQVQLLQSQREVEELSKGWEIQYDEVKLVKRIDAAAPGACGEVWLGEWQGMRVAFKKLNRALLELDEAGYTAEFDREIRFMRSIRHPNVVLFFGAGRTQDGTPFLVTEYMACGSLQEVLHEPEKSIDLSLKIRFALDAAKGMRFLHFCKPPRIHRDLKSGNLLVNDRWVVKVADFGTSRLLEGQSMEAAAAAAAAKSRGSVGLSPGGFKSPAAGGPPSLDTRRNTTDVATLRRGGGSTNRNTRSGGFLSRLKNQLSPGPAVKDDDDDGADLQPLLRGSTNGDPEGSGVDDGDDDFADGAPAVGRPTAWLSPSTEQQSSEGAGLAATSAAGAAGSSGEGGGSGSGSGNSSMTNLLAAERQAALFMTRHVGTPLYMAPEVMAGQPHTRASDVYSFGIVLWEIYMRQVPFGKLASSSIFKLRQEVQAGTRPDLHVDCPGPLAQLIRECWAQAPSDRPNFDNIVPRLTTMSELSSLYGNQLTPGPKISGRATNAAGSGSGGGGMSGSGAHPLHTVVSSVGPAREPSIFARAIKIPKRRHSGQPAFKPSSLDGSSLAGGVGATQGGKGGDGDGDDDDDGRRYHTARSLGHHLG